MGDSNSSGKFKWRYVIGLILMPLVLFLRYGDRESIIHFFSRKSYQETQELMRLMASLPQDEAKSSTVAPTSNAQPPGAQDIAHLNAAMHGAASQQPDDAPKDSYGKPYIIGDLGGVAVNLPASIVRYVEYDDSPGFNPERLRNYQPPTRSYSSPITSFGFTFRNHDRQFLDRNNGALLEAKKQARGAENDWVSVSISAMQPDSNPDWLNNTVKNFARLDPIEPDDPVRFHWVPSGVTVFGLEEYIHPGIDAKTGKPWRMHKMADDYYVARTADGRVQTVIRCSNMNVINLCKHYFYFPSVMKIRINMTYERAVLSQWQQFEESATRLVLGFAK